MNQGARDANDESRHYAESRHRERELKQWAEQPTLRDQFAMAALTGLLATPEPEGSVWPHGVSTDDQIMAYLARKAYSYASAMVEARKVKP